MQICTLLQTDNHISTPLLCFLQAGCPSCRPTNSVKALKAHDNDAMVSKTKAGPGQYNLQDPYKRRKHAQSWLVSFEILYSTCVVPQTLSCYGNRTFAATGPRLWNSLLVHRCVILTSPTDCSNDSWRDTFFGKHEHGALWLLICGIIEKHLLTYQCDSGS